VNRFSSLLRSRIVPAVLTATGVSLIAGGLLTYTGAAEVASPEPSPTIVTMTPRPSLALPTLPPLTAPPSSGPSPSPVVDRVATRVRVEALKIDLAVVKQPGGSNAYPLCNVAMYLGAPLKQPGQGGSTYLYAHARDGMFGPIYERAIQNKHGGPSSMLGMIVEVWTSDDMVFTYQITEVKLHQLTLDDPIAATTEELWLQTSEGPKGTKGKTMLKAVPLVVLPASHADAHPTAKPVVCG
jgi:hypothetical protein